MTHDTYFEQLRKKLTVIAPGKSIESLVSRKPRPPMIESAYEGTLDRNSSGRQFDVMVTENANSEVVRKATALRKLANGDFDDVSPRERILLEAIVEEVGRPVTFIRSTSFDPLPDPWESYNTAGPGMPRTFIEAAIPAIGRIEIPPTTSGGTARHLGTGFIVGSNLMMTNRHVAQIFVRGVGRRKSHLSFVPGTKTAIDFRREYESTDSLGAAITDIVMIHPYWDMALFRLEGMPDDVQPLTISTAAPEDLIDRRIAVLGYPAKYNNPSPKEKELEAKHYQGIYGVKRLAPGEITGREQVESLGNLVSAMTHDSSTLPGNSGSAVLDVTSGEVVGLHFAGITLKTNYSVPMFELARDKRVVDAGVHFKGTLPAATDAWNTYWQNVDTKREDDAWDVSTTYFPTKSETLPAPQQLRETATWTIPLTVTVSFGKSQMIQVQSASQTYDDSAGSLFAEASFQQPIINDGLETRRGYDPKFLDPEGGSEVPLPHLTETGEAIVSRLQDNSYELKYHRFSVVMHKHRRLALFTASNVSWLQSERTVDGRKPTREELTGIPRGVQEEWVIDPRIPADEQLPDIFFTKDRGAFDKGHLVRRDDVAWSAKRENSDRFAEMQMANGDTYHTTNCSPQVSAFNRAPKGDINWGDLESMIQKQTRTERVTIFSGPVLSKYDRIFKGIAESGLVKVQIPGRFWKVVVSKTDTGTKAFGFVLEQDLTSVPLELTIPDAWKPFQVSIAEIEALMFGLVSWDWFKPLDAKTK